MPLCEFLFQKTTLFHKKVVLVKFTVKLFEVLFHQNSD